jgi:hypothetical protein
MSRTKERTGVKAVPGKKADPSLRVPGEEWP